MSREPEDGAPAPIEFIPFSGEDHESAEVSFGARRSKRNQPNRSTSKRWIAVCAVGALVIGAFIFGGHDSKTRASPITTVGLRTGVSTTPATADSTASTGLSNIPPDRPQSPASCPTVVGATGCASSDPSTDPPSTVPTAGPLYPNDQGLGLYLAGNSSITRIDLATGVEADVPNPTGGLAVGVVRTDNVTVPLTLSGPAGGPSSIVLGLDGTAWTADENSPRLHHVRPKADGTYELLGDVPTPPSIGFNAYLIGTTSDSRPVVGLRDNRAYAVDPTTGALQRLADGVVNEVQHGFYLETVCSETGACVVRLHGSAVVEIPVPSAFFQASFSPDGTRVLIVESMDTGPLASLIDLSTGTRVRLPTDLRLGDGLGTAWVPDGSVVFHLGVSRATGTVTLVRFTTGIDVADTLIVPHLTGDLSIIGIA